MNDPCSRSPPRDERDEGGWENRVCQSNRKSCGDCGEWACDNPDHPNRFSSHTVYKYCKDRNVRPGEIRPFDWFTCDERNQTISRISEMIAERTPGFQSGELADLVEDIMSDWQRGRSSYEETLAKFTNHASCLFPAEMVAVA